MHAFEAVIVGYMAYVALLAWARPMGARRRRAVTLVALSEIGLIVLIARADSSLVTHVRHWAPPAHILLGYWLSGAFFERPMTRLEERLLAIDRRVFERTGLDALVARGPRALLEGLEAAYAAVYLVIPAGFAVVTLAAPAADVDRYWIVVVSAELLCYAALPWIQTRTPHDVEPVSAIDARPVAARRLNRWIASRASIRVCTIPSGHVAGATATALAAGVVLPWAGAAFGVLALAIAAGSVIGRYHYALDAVLGAGVAVLVWLAV